MTEQPEPVTTPTAVQQAVERLTTLCSGDVATPQDAADLRTVLAALTDAERERDEAIDRLRHAIPIVRMPLDEARDPAQALIAHKALLAAAEARLAEMREALTKRMRMDENDAFPRPLARSLFDLYSLLSAPLDLSALRAKLLEATQLGFKAGRDYEAMDALSAMQHHQNDVENIVATILGENP